MVASTPFISSRAQARRTSKAPLAGRRILLAEDEALIGFHLKRILEDFGCEAVGPIGSIEEVLEIALHGRFDGALLDVNLRSRQIFDILPTLQKLGLRIILASGYDDATLFPPAYRAMPRIAKPFSEKELLRVCERTFASPAKRSRSPTTLRAPRQDPPPEM
jgi:DNA-binding NtrC family response regulator